jgi:tetratricopeptide (TPR) repeat protein
MFPYIVVLMVLAQAAPIEPAARPPLARTVAPVPDRRGDAYFEFLRGRHLEGEGEVEGAIAAYRRAVELDPASAEIQAELAALYARQNRADEAIAAAEAALRADPANVEAHWVLGTVYAALAQGDTDGPPVIRDALDKAILHLEEARPSRRYDLGLSLALGRLYLRKADHARAIEQLKWLADQEPGAAEVLFLLAQAYDGAGNSAEAVATLRQVTALEPRYYRAWVMLAELLERQRAVDEALAAYEQAIAQNPRSIELRLRQATLMLNAGRVAPARQLLERLLEDAPTEGGALYLLAEAQRQLKDYDEAEATAKRLIALEPTQIRGAYALALTYEGRREHRKVIDTLTPAIAGATTPEAAARMAPLYVRLGLAHQELGAYREAITAFERARAGGAGDPLFDAYLAQALVASGAADRALEITSAARAERPDDFRFARLHAEALAKAGRVDEATGLLEQEVSRHGGRPDVHLSLAALYAEHERFDRAASVLDMAEKQFPGNPLVAFQRGALYERQQRYQEAEQAFRQALGRDPLHAPTLNYLGYMFAERGEHLDEAVSLLERALEADPWNGSYLDSLGWAHYMRGDLVKAQKFLHLAVERLPSNSVVQDHWGDLLWKQGDRAGAITAWERALQGDGESIDVETIKKKIQKARP